MNAPMGVNRATPDRMAKLGLVDVEDADADDAAESAVDLRLPNSALFAPLLSAPGLIGVELALAPAPGIEIDDNDELVDGGSDADADADEGAEEGAEEDDSSETRLDALSAVGVASTDEATPAKRPITPSVLPVLDRSCVMPSALIAAEAAAAAEMDEEEAEDGANADDG